METVENVVSSADEHGAFTTAAAMVASGGGSKRSREPMRATETFSRISAFSRFEPNAGNQGALNNKLFLLVIKFLL